MKYNHDFKVLGVTPSSRLYGEENTRIQLDFYPSMMRVAIYKEGDYLFPTFSICPGKSVLPQWGRKRLSNDGLSLLDVGSDPFRIKGDCYEVEIDPHNFRLTYRKENGEILFQDREILAYNLEGEFGKGSYHALTREEDEHIYGLGDKTGNVNKNGRRFKMETFDAMGFDSRSSDPLYKQIPFYICANSKGSYGIYYDTYSNGVLDFGAEINNYYPPYKHAEFEEEALVYYVFFGSIKEIIHSFSYLTGKSFLPPKWSFKYCGSTMAYTDGDHPVEELRNFVSKCREYEIDCGGFYLSSGYTQIGDKRCVFHWNKDKFPDPKGFAEEMKKEGISFLPNIKPAFLTSHPMYEELARKGYFLHYKDGTPATFPFWGGMASYLDFTNKGAYSFWSKCCKESLIDLGYESLWNDNNEFDIHDEEILADGFGHPLPAKRIRSLMPLLMTMASTEAMDLSKRHMEVTRSAPAGFQRYAQTWTGDNRTSFSQFRGNHKMAMTMALSGVAFFGQDIGGFAGPAPDKELFLRWIQYGLFTPRFCLHSWNKDGSSTMPWLYPELKEPVKRLFALRKRLLPYLYSEAMNAAESYMPMLSPVFLKHPGYSEESDLFYCGSSILVCPIFDEGVKSFQFELPEYQEGFYLGSSLREGAQEEIVLPTDLPLFYVKAGSVLPVIEDGLTLEIYPLESGEFEYRFYSDDSSLANPYDLIKVSCTKGEVIVKGVPTGAKVKLLNAKSRKLTIQ